MVEEDQLHAAPPQLVDQEHLVDVGAGQAVGRVDVEPVEAPGGRLVAQPLQRGADQVEPL